MCNYWSILGDHWEYTLSVAAKQGDILYFWLWGEKNSSGETLTGQRITLGGMYCTYCCYLNMTRLP